MEKSKFFLSPGLDVGQKQSRFFKGLEITYLFIFLSAQSNNINIKSVKKNNEKYGKIKKIFFRRCVCISVGCKHILLKDLKLPIYPYFCWPNRTILSWLKK